MARTSGRSLATLRQLAGLGGRSESDRSARRRRGARRLGCSLPPELLCDADGAEKEDLIFGVAVVGINETAPPAARRLIGFALAFRTDQTPAARRHSCRHGRRRQDVRKGRLIELAPAG